MEFLAIAGTWENTVPYFDKILGSGVIISLSVQIDKQLSVCLSVCQEI